MKRRTHLLRILQRSAWLVLPLLLLGGSVRAFAQQAPPTTRTRITGVVRDMQREPLPGVNIQLKGSTQTTYTNGEGKFDFTFEAPDKVLLIFSFMGMKTQEVDPKDRKELIVVMEEDLARVEDIVVTGYQVLDKRSQTSAITSVKVEEIYIPGVVSIDQMLEGRVPEMSFTLNSGEVGATPRLRVRGTSTLLGNREPLWVLDGIVMSDPVDIDPEELNNPDYLNIVGNAIAGINPQDIERIDVLKDASATALYGTRAANGVIVVTTKQGRVGKPVLSYNHASKVTRRPRYTDRAIHLMNSAERVAFGKELADAHYLFPEQMPLVGYEGALYRLQTGQISHEQFRNEAAWYETVNTDWFDLLTDDVYSHTHNLSVSGGNQQIRYYSSLGYDRDNGVMNRTFTERYTLSTNVDVHLSPKLRFNVKINGNVQKKEHLADGLNAMDYAYNTTRALPAFNEDGTPFYYERYRGGYSVGHGSKYLRYNILNEIENSANSYDGRGMGANLNLQYKIRPTWDAQATASYSTSSTLQEKWWGDQSAYIASMKNGEYEDRPLTGTDGHCILPYGGLLKRKNSTTESLVLRLQTNWRKQFGKDNQHLLTALLGYEVGTNRSKISDEENRGYIKERGMQFIDMSALNLEDYPYYAEWVKGNHLGLTRGLTNTLSGYVSLSYSFHNYFTLNVNGRMDASNKFGSRSNERFLPVWSASGMWNIKQTLLKEVDWIPELRLKASYGRQGNMLDGQTPNMLIRQMPMSAYYNETVSNVSQFPNPNLQWEETQQTNLGLEAGLLNGRLNLSANYYYKKTSDAFTWVNVAATNGLTTYVMNNGDIHNSGYSVSVSAIPVRSRNFMWRLSTSYSQNRNTVRTDVVENYNLDDYLTGRAIVSGQPVGSFYSYKFLGLNAANGTPVFDDFADRRHLLEEKSLEEIVTTVMEKSGTREPVFIGNLFNTFTWKGFTLSFNLSYSLGTKVRLFSLYEPIIRGISADNNVRRELLDRWQRPGDETRTQIPAIISRSAEEYAYYNSHWSSEQSNKTKNFAKSLWNMYDNADIRVISGNYLKMQSLNFRYSFSRKALEKLPFSSASVSFNTQNLFTIGAKALKGQDPSQAGFAKPNLSVRPMYTMGLNLSF